MRATHLPHLLRIPLPVGRTGSVSVSMIRMTNLLKRPGSTGVARQKPGTGKVYLVGGGPGDPELLTLRAARLIREAEVIVHDHLVNPDILDLASSATERIYVGKEAGNHTLPQERIKLLLVRLAQQGKQVVRLKGGDPFIFGRGGEELETLVEHGVPFEVVPGVSAALGMAAYSGIPLTHRDHAQSCVFATGHLKDGTCHLDWAALARPRQTVVIYMGIASLEEIRRELTGQGVASDMPVAVVQNATLPSQRCLVTTLAALPEDVARAGMTPPALIVIGEVVRYHEKLAWFARTEAGQDAGAA